MSQQDLTRSERERMLNIGLRMGWNPLKSNLVGATSCCPSVLGASLTQEEKVQKQRENEEGKRMVCGCFGVFVGEHFLQHVTDEAVLIWSLTTYHERETVLRDSCFPALQPPCF